MADLWSEIQSVKTKTLSLREKLAQRKKQRLDVVADIRGTTINDGSSELNQDSTTTPINTSSSIVVTTSQNTSSLDDKKVGEVYQTIDREVLKNVEIKLLDLLIDISLNLPVEINYLYSIVSKSIDPQLPLYCVENLIEKYAAQSLLTISSLDDEEDDKRVILTLDHTKLAALHEHEIQHEVKNTNSKESIRKRKSDNLDKSATSKKTKYESEKVEETIESLLSTHSAKERENKKITESILQLLGTATAKERVLSERFKSQGGNQVKEFCMYGTREECRRLNGQSSPACNKLHFIKIISKHTDESLGDCSFLNTCFHMDSCKFVHYQIDYPAQDRQIALKSKASARKVGKSIAKTPAEGSSTTLFPSQWVQCDLRKFNMSVLGKFAVVMADPPWDIHMELPYGTMSDEEMRKLSVPMLQDEGYIFLWVTGRAMELGRECLQLWGYERADELIWVKTNQLQRIIRTGRTGHWLNHGKEHCLVGVKGNPKGMNRGLDCDVIVSEVRATSHKPDEIYGIIERLSPGSRKIELFGRPHNIQPNWVTLGNQVDGVKLLDPEVVRAFKSVYPDGNCL